MRKLRNYLELIRFPNLFTAMADVVAGGWVVYASSGEFSAWPLFGLMLSSACLYAMGIVMNDYADFELDRRERPERPLPSGRIKRSTALFLGVIFGAAGIGLAAFVHWASFAIACAIAVFILLYDFICKSRFLLGPITMGICRGLNLLLGISLVPDQLPDVYWLSLIGFVYISTVTVMAKGEVGNGLHPHRVWTMAFIILLCACIIFLMGSATLWVKALAVIIFLFWSLWAMLPSLQKPDAIHIRRAVGKCIVGLPLLDAAIAASFGGGSAWLSVAIFMVFSMVFARLFAVT